MPILIHGADDKTLTAREIGALPLTGGTLTGDVDFSGHSILDISWPRSPRDAACKEYVDDLVQGYRDTIPAHSSTSYSLANGLVVIGNVGTYVFAKIGGAVVEIKRENLQFSIQINSFQVTVENNKSYDLDVNIVLIGSRN